MRHGGRRPGAGRKLGPLGPAVPLAVRVPERVRDALQAEAEARSVTLSELVGALLRRCMVRRGRV